MTDEKRIQSPITLYVESIDFKPRPEFGGSRVTVIDLEINEIMAKQIIDEITKRLEQDVSLGTIRVRFAGRLVVG